MSKGSDFNVADQGPVRSFEEAMRREGWAAHVTVAGSRDVWRQLAAGINTYKLTIDDYTNDLYARNYLQRAVRDLPAPLNDSLSRQVDELDRLFRANTES